MPPVAGGFVRDLACGIIDQRWLKTSGGTHTDRFQYGYDRNGNRLFEKNLVDAAFSELYQANGPSADYDKLNQLTDFRRGVLSDSNSDGIPDTVTTASRSQAWDFDALGNFDNQSTNGTGQTRSHNRQNQVTSIQGLTTPAYDANGNLTTDQSGKTLIYDAWNRLVEVKNGSSTLIDYAHDALTRRITENDGTPKALFYSSQWQVIEERESGLAVVQYVWSPVYVDAMILRDRDTDANGSPDERLWVQHDANFNVTALINASGTLVERYAYDPFGTPTFYDANYVTRSGSNFAWRHLHQGGAYEGLTGLHHFRHREYSPTLGRWIQVDPIGFAAGDANWYRVGGNQLPHVSDPFGLQSSPPPVSLGRPTTGHPIVSLGRPRPIPIEANVPPHAPLPRPGIVSMSAGSVSSPRPVVTLGTPLVYRSPPQTTDFSSNDYWAHWVNKHPNLTKDQYARCRGTLNRGCVGLTALELGIAGMPDTSNCFNSIGQAMKRRNEMVDNNECRRMRDCYGDPSTPLVFSIRFWSEGKAYSPGANGKIDMSGWMHAPKPRPGGGTYTNFDFGYYDWLTSTYTHANHCEPGMVVKISNEAGFSKPLLDFDKQVFCVACRDWQFGNPARKP